VEERKGGEREGKKVKGKVDKAEGRITDEDRQRRKGKVVEYLFNGQVAPV